MAIPLPTVAERAALAADLAALIAKADCDVFVAAPLVEPNDRYFPDPWQRDSEGVARLARRVFAYAGLEAVEIEVVPGTSDNKHTVGMWLIDATAERLQVAADRERMDDPLALIATLARHAAIIFRLRHDLRGETDEVENR